MGFKKRPNTYVQKDPKQLPSFSPQWIQTNDNKTLNITDILFSLTPWGIPQGDSPGEPSGDSPGDPRQSGGLFGGLFWYILGII